MYSGDIVSETSIVPKDITFKATANKMILKQWFFICPPDFINCIINKGNHKIMNMPVHFKLQGSSLRRAL